MSSSTSSFSFILSIIILLTLTLQVHASSSQQTFPPGFDLRVVTNYPFPSTFNGFSVPVVTHQRMHPSWSTDCFLDKEKTSQSPADVDNTAGPATCFMLSQFNERLNFQFGVGGGDLSMYDFEDPEVSVNSVVAPTYNEKNQPAAMIKGKLEVTARLDYDLGAESGTINLILQCPVSTSSRLTFHTVQVDFPFRTEAQVSFAFVKICTGGDHPHAKFGLYFPIITNAGAGWITEPILFHDLTMDLTYQTRFNLHLKFNAHPEVGFQSYANIAAQSSNPKIPVSFSGHFQSGLLSPQKMMNWSSEAVFVVHECNVLGDAIVQLSVQIPPFNPLIGKYKKVCQLTSKGKPKTVSVLHKLQSTSPDVKIYDIGGKINPAFYVDFQDVKKRYNDTSIYVVPQHVTHFQAHIQNADPNEAILVDSISVTVLDDRKRQNKQIIHAYVADEQSILNANIEGGKSIPLKVSLICLQDAEKIPVMVTVLFAGYNRIEFGFIKVCTKPRTIKHRAYILTAGRVMFLIATALTATILYGITLILKQESAIIGKRQQDQVNSSQTRDNLPEQVRPIHLPGSGSYMRMATAGGAKFGTSPRS